jgi:hypothetical protein
MIKALLLAAAIAGAAATPAWSGETPPPPPKPPPVGSSQPGPGAGPWIVGGMIVSAASLIVCGVWECQTSHKEMSNAEAITAAVIPFSCFWYRQTHSDHGPTCSGYHKP